MCFSATASFVAGGSLTLAGGIIVKQAKRKKEIPFASIPLIFGIQQLIEGVVWLSFTHPSLNFIATYAYSLFSHVFWPAFLPVAVLMLERDLTRKKILSGFCAVGFLVASSLLYSIIREPIISEQVGSSIAYRVLHSYPFLAMIAYLLATCFACLFSGHKAVKIFGITLFLSFFMAFQFFSATFFSVWCFFAAILSVIVYWHFRRQTRVEQRQMVTE